MILDVEKEMKQYGTKKFGVSWWKSIISGDRFIAKSGDELYLFLGKLTKKPIGKTYDEKLYRSLTIESQTNYGAIADKMTDHYIYSSWGRYDLDKAENAMYLSKTIDGNMTEVLHYVNDWKKWNTYEFTNVKLDNLLDLTDDLVRQQLGTQFEDLVKIIDRVDSNEAKIINYEMTNVLASWARKNGYNGIIAPGARGTQNYENIIIFEQTYIDQVLKGKTIEKLVK